MNHGRGDVLWNVLQEPSAPSYANFVNQGRTTIPESWDFAGSQNHMILLQIDEWFNAGLAGIRRRRARRRYDRVVIKPQAVGTLSHVAGTYESPHGTIASEWTKGANGIASMKVSVPAGSTATVYVPGARRRELRRDLAAARRRPAARRLPGVRGRAGRRDVRAGHEHRRRRSAARCRRRCR